MRLPGAAEIGRRDGDDLHGNCCYDLPGSYGVNLFAYDFYRDCMADGAARVARLGPVLGTSHPGVAGNVARLRAISGLDEVSFHMSGTEAVMWQHSLTGHAAANWIEGVLKAV